MGDGMHKVEENNLECVVKLTGLDASVDPVHLQVLNQLLEWPKGKLLTFRKFVRLVFYKL